MVEENDSASAAATLPLHSRTNGKYHQLSEEAHPARASNQQDEDASFRQKVEALLLCAVCHETVTDPRELSCGHFFCSECLDLLNVDDIVKCALCGTTTPITDAGVRKHDLAGRLADLLIEFSKPVHKEIENGDVEMPLMMNGTIHHQQALSEEEEEDTPESDNHPQTNGDSAPEDDQSTADDVTTSHQEQETEPHMERHVPDNVLSPAAANIAVETDAPHIDAQKAPHSPEDNVYPQTTESNDFTPVITAEVHRADTEPEDMEFTPPPPSPPPVETVQEQDPSADITIEPPPPPPSELVIEPIPGSKPEDEAEVKSEESPKEPEVSTTDDSILQPPEDYQSPPAAQQEEPPALSGDLLVKVDIEPIPRHREPIEQSERSDDEKPASPTPEDTDEPDLKPLNTSDPLPEPSAPEAKPDLDETDYKMKPSEIKPSEVALAIESQRQCGTCHSAQCTCNTSSLLTPPVSMGSQQSVETNASQNASEDDEAEILVEQLSRFSVKESASHIEVASKNKIHVTRWTYDDDGAIDTFDQNGKKMKCIHSGHQSFTGITLSKLGFLFALNTTKKRIEEYGSADGRKVKNFKLDYCNDPQAVDIMPSGELLVVDQERHRVIVYPNNRKSNSKPRAITHSLLREPYDVAATNDGFYVTCAATHCLLKMDLNGEVLWSFGDSGDSSKKFKAPQGVCVDEVGMVYVVDKALNCIYMFNKDGQLKGRITDKGREAMKRPWYISVKDGLMAVLFSHNIVKTYQFV